MAQGLEARNIIAYTTLAVDGAVGLIDAGTPITSNVKRAVITVETDSVRYREDGTDPTSTTGHLLYAGDTLQYMDANYQKSLNNLNFIKVTTAAALKITFYD